MKKENLIANILEWQQGSLYTNEELQKLSIEELEEILEYGYF